MSADKAYSNREIRAYLRKRGIRHAIPEKQDHKAARLHPGSRGGRLPGFGKARYRHLRQWLAQRGIRHRFARKSVEMSERPKGRHRWTMARPAGCPHLMDAAR
ncbi:hypothetical protein [Streptomyces sp. NRRL S-118]|uniref:hypothetical protein n=1 Tax=Streptomyces sp. NRRL S-118 TaxID=1463881 RepID=UPI00131C8B3A